MAISVQTFGFPVVTEAPSLARTWIREVLTSWDLADLRDVSELLVSELVTNVVVHSKGCSSGHIVARLGRSALTVLVVDHGRGIPQPRVSAPSDTNGRGLQLVECLSDAWGVLPVPAGKAVFFRLKISKKNSIAEPSDKFAEMDSTNSIEENQLEQAAAAGHHARPADPAGTS